MAMMNNLYKWMEYVGLEVLTLNGWSTRGSSSFSPTIGMCHWIAGPRGVKPPNRPSLTVIRDGHSRLPGPLANEYMGRAGEVVLVAAGRCNHAGYGYWKGVTGNTGAMGTEPEAADNSDWTAEQRKSYPLIKIAELFAMWEKGLISWNQIASNRIVGHSEYALPKGRKQDINGYTMTSMRAQIAALIPGFKKRVNKQPIKVDTAAVFNRDTYKFTDGTTAPTPTTPGKDWFSMATEAQLRKIIREELNPLHSRVAGVATKVWQWRMPHPVSKKSAPAWMHLVHARANITKVNNSVWTGIRRLNDIARELLKK